MKQNKSATSSIQSQGVPQDKSRHDWKTLMDVTTFAYQIVILLALIFLNVLMVVGVTDTTYLVGTILTAIVLPLLVTLIANRVIKRNGI